MFSLFILLALSAPLALAQRDGISYDTYSDESVSASRYDSDNCESNSYSVYGYLSNNEQRMITIEASYNNYCDDYDYISYYACANLRVPKKATWTREGNRVTVKASATLKDCGYYSSDGGGAPRTPHASRRAPAAPDACIVIEAGVRFALAPCSRPS